LLSLPVYLRVPIEEGGSCALDLVRCQ